jgi:hypothetical protein
LSKLGCSVKILKQKEGKTMKVEPLGYREAVIGEQDTSRGNFVFCLSKAEMFVGVGIYLLGLSLKKGRKPQYWRSDIKCRKDWEEFWKMLETKEK